MRESLPMVEVTDLGICFRASEKHHNHLKNIVLKWLRGEKSYRQFWAVRDVKFEIHHGDIVGIIGRNGAGKTTLCSAISQIYKPDEGEVVVRGHVVPILSLGVGMNIFMTGRENIHLCGSLMGFTREMLLEKEREIIAFSGLGQFIDEPVKTYSSGMTSRLAFSVATCVEPDILILDEVFSVGDAEFQMKSQERIQRLREHAKCVLFVSHSLSTVREFCTKCMWLERGKIQAFGETDEVVDRYYEEVMMKRGISQALTTT